MKNGEHMSKFKLVLASLATALIGFAPLAVSASSPVTLDSQVNVLNATAGQTTYAKSTTAKIDDVVNIEVWYENTETADSGKVANNLTVKVALPAAAGQNQTVTSTVSSDNSNTSVSTANITLSVPQASLEYIPGTATWRHNVGDNTNVNYQTTKISDSVMTSGVNLGNLNPCTNFESTIVVQARVIAPIASIQKLVKVDGSNAAYAASNTANPGDTLDYLLKVANQGNTTLQGVAVGDNLPPYETYVAGSTVLVDSNTGSAGKKLVDGITTGGVNIDDMAPGGQELIYFKVKVSNTLPCGTNALQNVGIVRAKGFTNPYTGVTTGGVSDVYNVATTTVKTICPTPTPPVTPPTSTKLPQTGATGALGGAAGLTGVGYAAQAYLRSKKSLLDAFKK
jgi:uncharacterized repeat protein (TIGR01451 family)